MERREKGKLFIPGGSDLMKKRGKKKRTI